METTCIWSVRVDALVMTRDQAINVQFCSCLNSSPLTFSLSFSNLTAVLSVTCLWSLSTKASRSSRILSSMAFCCSSSSEIRLPSKQGESTVTDGGKQAAASPRRRISQRVERCLLPTVRSDNVIEPVFRSATSYYS